jgi:uncharacterized membrane protein
MQQLCDAARYKAASPPRWFATRYRCVTVWAGGLVFIAIGSPLTVERVPPNNWYGFRTAKTFSNRTISYTANRVANIDLIIAGVFVALGVLAMFILRETVLPTLRIARWGFGLFIVATVVVLHASDS